MVHIDVGGADSEEERLGYIHAYFGNLDVLCNTWALAGMAEVEYADKRIKYAAWEETTAYYYEIWVRRGPHRNVLGEQRARVRDRGGRGDAVE
eukprot:9539025-Heterocapsa_arctica.AAC.1